MSVNTRQRIDRAGEALKPYQVLQFRVDKAGAVTDLLADLMHYCKQNRISFKEHLKWAEMHFGCEEIADRAQEVLSEHQKKKHRVSRRSVL